MRGRLPRASALVGCALLIAACVDGPPPAPRGAYPPTVEPAPPLPDGWRAWRHPTFSLRTPAALENEPMGGDSYVRRYVGPGIAVDLDHGVYTGTTLSRRGPDVKLTEETIGGQRALLAEGRCQGPDGESRHLVEVLFPDGRPSTMPGMMGARVTLRVAVYVEDATRRDEALAILRSVRFHEPSSR